METLHNWPSCLSSPNEAVSGARAAHVRRKEMTVQVRKCVIRSPVPECQLSLPQVCWGYTENSPCHYLQCVIMMRMLGSKVVFSAAIQRQFDKSKTKSQSIWLMYTPYQVIQEESFSLIPQVVSLPLSLSLINRKLSVHC